jgi:hypothetical protein
MSTAKVTVKPLLLDNLFKVESLLLTRLVKREEDKFGVGDCQSLRDILNNAL